jgi:prepilin-type N-terminal cleavage/methylation domain-containing protein
MRKGFTLLEILVAMSLLFVVLTVVYQTFEIHTRSMERARGIQRGTQTARLALTMMARDLQSAFWESKVSGDEGEEEEEEIGETAGEAMAKGAEAYFLVQPVQEEGRPWDRMAFLTLGPTSGPFLAQYPWVHAVEYRLAREVETRRVVLVRRQNLLPGKDLLVGGEEWTLAEGVRGFQVQCVSAQGETSDSWDSRERKALPRLVLLRLWVADPQKPDDEAVLYSLRVALPSYGEEES